MAFSIRCPICRKKFPWEPAVGFPDECPNPECQSRIAHDREDDDVVMPFIRTSAKTKATDQVYRDMEHASEHRAQQAMELTGASAAEVASLKITDLKPTRHEGAIAAPSLPAHLQNVGRFAGSGSEFAVGTASGAVTVDGKTTTGIVPNAGMKAQSTIQRLMRGY